MADPQVLQGSISDHNNETKKSVGILDYRYTCTNTWGNTCEYR